MKRKTDFGAARAMALSRNLFSRDVQTFYSGRIYLAHLEGPCMRDEAARTTKMLFIA
jgi:hypothetical protein